MSLKVKILLLIFSLAYLIFHFYTLSLNPIPWVDEVFFASISKTFMESGKLIPEVSKEMWGGEEVLIYGPIHFFIESMSFRLFGFGIMEYRWVTFIFGILTILATASLLKFYHNNWKIICLLIILFALDPFFQLSLHEGRMDLVTVFFMLAGIWFLLNGLKTKNNWLFLASGLMITTSLLTTPRSGFIFISILLVFMISLEGKVRKGSLLKLVWWGLPLLLFYGFWIFYKFSGIQSFFDYYQHIRETNSEYVGGRLYIPRQEYAIIFLTAISVVYGIFKKGLSYFNELVIISVISIILFYIIVLDWGPYSILVLPFYYFLFFHSFSDLQLKWKNPAIYALLLLFTVNLSFSSLKGAQVISEKDIRNPEIALRFVQKNIPPGSKVIGDPTYYYAIMESGSEYRMYHDFLSLEERERLLREVYDYDYMIVTNLSIRNQPEVSEYYLKNAQFIKIAELKTKRSAFSKMIAELKLVSDMEKDGYSAVIYARIKKDTPSLAENRVTQK